jgi:RimJ/RimL family protein N-acetyltransferase
MRPMPVDAAVGVIDEKSGGLVGAAIFQNFNGNSLDFSYYGERTLSLGITRALARVALSMGAARVTIMTSKKNKRILRWLPKIGCKLEGTSRRYYGHRDESRSTAVRFVLFAEDLQRIAGPSEKLGSEISC